MADAQRRGRGENRGGRHRKDRRPPEPSRDGAPPPVFDDRQYYPPGLRPRPPRKGWPVPKLPIYIAAFLGVFLLLNFIAPYTIEPGSVRDLDGGANRIDYNDKWEDMNPLARGLYWFGDLNCHQKEERTYILNDNQMPFCARDVGFFLGMSLGSLVMGLARPSYSIGETAMSAFPGRMRVRRGGAVPPIAAAVVIWGLFLLPMGIDGFYQLLTDYESNNTMRLVTGTFGGMAMGVLLLAPILSALAPWEDLEMPTAGSSRD